VLLAPVTAQVIADLATGASTGVAIGAFGAGRFT